MIAKPDQTTPPSHDRHTRSEYDQRAPDYMSSPIHAQGRDLDDIAEHAGQRPDAVALDLGCGAGHVSFRLAPRVGRVIAADLSPGMLDVVSTEAVQRGLRNIEVMQAAAEDLPMADARFDLVVSRYSAHHWRDLRAGLAEAVRVLRPGGLAIFSDVMAPGQGLLDTWLQSLELLRDTSHARNETLATWIELLTANGLQILRVQPGRLALEFASWVARTRTPAEHIRAIRSLQSMASAEVKSHFRIDEDGSWTVDTGLIVARKP